MDGSQSGEITIRPFSGHLEAINIDALADEFRKHFPNAVVRVEPYPLNIGGPLEAFFEITLEGGKEVLLSLLADLASDAVRSIRPVLWAALRRQNATQLPDIYGLSIRSGDFRMYVRKSLDEIQDKRRFEAARRHAESLPVAVFKTAGKLDNPGIYWDEDGQEWKPAPKHELYGEFCPAESG